MHIGRIKDMNDDLERGFETHVHFRIPHFCDAYKNQPNYTEQLSLVKNKSKLVFTMCYQTNMSEDEPEGKYLTKLIEWYPKSMFVSTVTTYKILSEMKGNSLMTIKDIDFINKNPELRNTYHKSISIYLKLN